MTGTRSPETTRRTAGLRGVAAARLQALPGGVTTFAMTAALGLDFCDQSAIGATAPEVRHAFGIGQTQIGILATSSTIVGVICTIPFGILADRMPRLRVLRATVVLWMLGMLLVGSAPTFGVMFFAHAVLGLVTGAAGPLVASLVGDLVPRGRRGRVYSSLLLGELIGSAFGLAVPGEIAALFGWRWAYWMLAVPGLLVLSLLTRATEPPRAAKRVRGSPQSALAELSFADALRLLIRNRTNVVLILASALGYYFFSGVQTFSVSLLTDDYHVSKTVAPALTLLVSLGLAVGVLIGGPAGDRLLARNGKRGRLPLVVAAFAGSLLFIIPALGITTVGLTVPLLIIGGVLLGNANPSLDATRIDIVPGRLLGRAEAVRTTIKDGADATAPVVFGLLGASVGLRHTFLIMTSSLVLALLLCIVSLRTYGRDIAAVAET